MFKKKKHLKTHDASLKDFEKTVQKTLKNGSLFGLPIRIVKVLLQYILLHLFSNFTYLFIRKRKKTKPIIGFSNIYYNGNPRAVFEYMLKHEDKYEIFWAAMNLKSLKDVKKSGGKAFLIDGIFGIPYFLKADIWVVAHKGRDVPFLPHKNYRIIQLWHALGTKGIPRNKETFEEFDAWCVSSDFSKDKYIELWDAPSEKLFVTGFAEMDTLFKHLKTEKSILLDEIGIKQGKKIILYAPTWDLGLWPWKNEYEEFEKLCMFCKERKLILILRLHPYVKIKKKLIKNIIQKYKNVYWLDMSEEPDTMKLLAVADILITDWSSIYTNYLLTKRPMIFLDVENEYFTKKRGKLEIPSEFRAGEISHNTEEFYNLLNFVLENGNRYRDKQEELLKIIYGNVDGDASKNVVEIIEKISKKIGQENT